MLKVVKNLNSNNLHCFFSRRFLSTASQEFPVKFERIEEIAKSPSGWVPRANPPPELQFDIERSKTNNIPVYVSYSHGRAKVITTVRKVRGDIKVLERCVREHLGDEHHYQVNELTNQLKVKGNHRDKITRLLKELGF